MKSKSEPRETLRIPTNGAQLSVGAYLRKMCDNDDVASAWRAIADLVDVLSAHLGPTFVSDLTGVPVEKIITSSRGETVSETVSETPPEAGCQPMQEIYIDADGRVRFRANAVVRWLVSRQHMVLNEIAALNEAHPFPTADLEQLYQLLGYSVSGFGGLDFVRPSTVALVDAAAARLRQKD